MPHKKFTDAGIQKLPAPTKQTDYFDRGYPGLALRVTVHGVKSWSYFARVHGKVKRATLGRYPDLSLHQARCRAGEVAAAMRKGVDPTAAKREAKRAERNAVRDAFGAVADEWLKRDQSKNRSYAEVKRTLERDVRPAWDGRLITSITRRDCIELIDGVVDRGATTLARRVHAHLHRLFRWSVGRDILTANPMADLSRPGKAVRRERVLTDAELATVWKAATKWPCGPAIRLLILTGARREEIRALRWSEVHGDVIELAGERTKNGKPHTVPLSPLAAELLEGLPRIGKSEYVFTLNGKSPVSWSHAKERLDRAAGELAPWRTHDLRRTVATGLQRLGVSLQVVEACLGHVGGSRAGIVGVYQRHEYASEKRAALDAWARHVDGIVSGKKANVTQLRKVAP